MTTNQENSSGEVEVKYMTMSVSCDCGLKATKLHEIRFFSDGTLIVMCSCGVEKHPVIAGRMNAYAMILKLQDDEPVTSAS